MPFAADKARALSPQKKDRSRKGERDEQIEPLLALLNEHPDYYTTSSCAGRILVMTEAGSKPESQWLFLSHVPVSAEQVRAALSDLPADPVWVRMESFIVHVGCRTADAAETIVTRARSLGLKRAGIIGLRPRVMVEVIGNERLDAPIAERGLLVVSPEYLDVLIREGNRKLEANAERLSRFLDTLKAEFSAAAKSG